MLQDETARSSHLRLNDEFGPVHVCPLSRVREIVHQTKARHLVTLINHETMLETPAGIDSVNHLRIAINDIVEPREGLIHASEAHVEELIRFAQHWNRRGPLVVHCWAGISRSTAAAFITLCTLNPDKAELTLARHLRDASVTATPNKLLVRIADDILGRSGRMLKAIDEIGAGQQASEAVPFVLPSWID